MSHKTYVFTVSNGYITKGSKVDVPDNWSPAGVQISATVHPIGTDMKIYLNRTLVEALIKQGVLKRGETS